MGISTPKPIAFLEKRWEIFRTTAYFITEYVEGVDACHLIRAERRGDIPIQSVVKRFVKLLGLFAEATISHGDFKAANFIVSGDKLFVIDLDGMRKHSFRWRFRKAFKRDCERLMKNWTDLPELDKMFCDQIQKLKRL
jgi:tRNA A-37 threonylcarbamoyl transferase component Bud32